MEEPKMPAKRLKEIALLLFPDSEKDWKEKLATMLGCHVTTVRRWVAKDDVPKVAALAVEGVLREMNRAKETVDG